MNTSLFTIYNLTVFKVLTITILLSFFSCAKKTIDLSRNNLEVINRDIVSTIDNPKRTIQLNSQKGGGMAILKDVNFDFGHIDLEIKGENNPGKSFVGIAFNIQNDSTYEAIYFRPFNFLSEEKIKRSHSVQYISEPNNTWEFLRTNYKGQYEAEYTNAPNPDDWFKVRIKISKDSVLVIDKDSNTELLNIKRLEKQVSNKIALWTGNNSKGSFRNIELRN